MLDVQGLSSLRWCQGCLVLDSARVVWCQGFLVLKSVGGCLVPGLSDIR